MAELFAALRGSPFLCLTVNKCCRKHADFGTRIDQVALARSVISNKEKATVISRSTGRHQWAGKAFPDIGQFFLAFGGILAKSGMVPTECDGRGGGRGR